MIKNIAFYSFFKPDFDLEGVRDAVHERMNDFGIKGTIILGDEGINCSLSGLAESMDAFLEFLFATIRIPHSDIKMGISSQIAFKRARVKIKPYIVAQPGATPIDLSRDMAPYISPEDFHQWILDNKNMVVLDTRNDFEYQHGRFKNALHLGTRHFADFEDDLKNAPSEWQNSTIVTFCTGGIRCEKAAPLMRKKGFQNVYQLDGGILNYFKKIGRGYFEGECFVFDERVVV